MERLGSRRYIGCGTGCEPIEMGRHAQRFGDFRQRPDVAIMGSACGGRHRARSRLGRSAATAVRHAIDLGCRPRPHPDGRGVRLVQPCRAAITAQHQRRLGPVRRQQRSRLGTRRFWFTAAAASLILTSPGSRLIWHDVNTGGQRSVRPDACRAAAAVCESRSLRVVCAVNGTCPGSRSLRPVRPGACTCRRPIRCAACSGHDHAAHGTAIRPGAGR